MRLLLAAMLAAVLGCAPELAPPHPPPFPPCERERPATSTCIDAKGDAWSACAWTYYGRFLP